MSEKAKIQTGADDSSPTKSIFKHSTIYAIGNILRQLVSFIMLPIYTHYLTPSDYGVIGLISFAIAMFETVLGAKMVSALPKFYHDQNSEDDKNTVVSTAFIVTGSISAVTVLVIFLLRNLESQALFGTTVFGLIVGICGIQMLTQAVEYYGLMYIRLLNKPIEFVTINLLKLAVQLTLNIWLIVHLKLGVLGIAVSGLAATSVFGVGLSIRTLARTGLRFDTTIAKRMMAFSWPLWLSGLASIYIFSSNRYYIRILDSLSNVGLYELATKFSGILTLLVWGPFSQYWQTEQFRLIRRDDSDRLFQSIFGFLSCILLIGGLGVSIFSDPVIRVMSAPSFYPASAAVPFLLLSTIMASLTEFSSVKFFAGGKTGWLSKNNYLIAIVITALYFIFIPILGFVGAAAALATAQVIQFVSVHRTAQKEYGFKISLSPLAQMIGLCAIGYTLANYVFNQKNIWFDIPQKAVVWAITTGVLLAMLCRDQSNRERLAAVLNSMQSLLGRKSASSN